MDTKHKNSHIVFIRRLPQFASAARKELEEYFSESQRGYGSYFTKGSVRTATGLTPDEEKLLMPFILSIDPSEKDFTKQVNTWFEGLNVKVPGKDGLPLEIGLENSNTDPVSKDNLPLNVGNYITYRHALGHPWMAPTEDAGKGNQLKQYYIYDPNEVSKTTINVNEQKDKALTYYLTIRDNARSVNMYLTLMGVRTNTLRKGEEVVELRNRVDKNPKAFIDLYEDKDKEAKYIIEDMINNAVLERVGLRILIKEGGEQIGRDMKEAILYLQDARNTKTYNVLKARNQEKAKAHSISVDTDEDLPASAKPTVAATVTPVVTAANEPAEDPAKELIPPAAPELQEAAADSAGAIDE
jgi:hypothetical protein